jgi:hypothetical protein
MNIETDRSVILARSKAPMSTVGNRKAARSPDTSLGLIALSHSPYGFIRAAVRNHHPQLRQSIPQR